MKPLQGYIMEARGVVTDENDWGTTVKVILAMLGKDPQAGSLFVPDSYLPPWLASLEIVVRKTSTHFQGHASYTPSHSSMKDAKLVAQVEITTNMVNPRDMESTLNHEIQHAFDDWIIRTRRSGTLDDFMTVATGYSEIRMDDDPNLCMVHTVYQPAKVTFNDIFVVFEYCTYWLNQTEVNAYSREWAMFVPEFIKEKGNTYDWYKEIKTGDLRGQQPLMYIDGLHQTLGNWDKFTGIEDEDWEYIMGGLNHRWTKHVLGHRVRGTGKDGVRKVLEEVIRKLVPNVIRRYMRIIKDNGLVVVDGPDFLK